MSNYFSLSDDGFTAAEGKKKINKFKKDLVKNLPGIIVWGLLIIVVLATFADFTFANVKTFGFAANSLLFAICTYMTYYLRKHTGMSRGKADAGYLEAKRRHEEKCKEVVNAYDDDVTLADFCTSWMTEEANRARKSVLSGTGVTEEEWRKFAPLGRLAHKVTYSNRQLKGELKREKINQGEYDLLIDLKAMKGEKKLAICRACLIDKQRLTPSDIIFESANREARERTPISLKSVERRQDVTQLVSITIMMFGVIAIVPEVAAFDISIKTILYGLTRIASLLMTAFNADASGETIFTVDAVENFKVQDGFLEQAMKWREKHVRENTGTGSELEHAVPSDADGVRQVPCGGAPDGAAEEDPGSCHDGLSE